jgi:hypothetical protein
MAIAMEYAVNRAILRTRVEMAKANEDAVNRIIQRARADRTDSTTKDFTGTTRTQIKKEEDESQQTRAGHDTREGVFWR